MDENKIQGADGTEAPMTDEELKLRTEMEELAKTFQEELDKAKAEEEILANEREKEQEMLIQELEDNIDTESEIPEDIPEEELCECCGEKRRGTKENPDSPYCRDCERGLRRYPFEPVKVIIALIIIGLSVFACIRFTDNAKVYASSARAQHLFKQNKLYSAYSAYQTAIDDMENAEVNGELVYQRAVRNMLLINMLDDIPQYEDKFKMFELKLPHFRSAYDTFTTFEGFRVTQLDGNETLYSEFQKIEEAGGDYSQLPFAELVGKLDALLSVTTEESYKYQASLAEGAEESPDYPVKVEHYDETMINFLKFYAAALSEQDEEVQISYLEAVRAAHPELTWLYSAFLGDLYNRTGKDISALCEQLEKHNAEDELPDVIRVTAYRIGKNYTDAIALAQKNIDKQSSYTYEFYRQQALCYLAQGDYSKAYSAASESYAAYNYSIQVCNTYALCGLAAGKTEAYDEIAKVYAENSVTMSQEVEDFKNGATDLETILTKGDFDIA